MKTKVKEPMKIKELIKPATPADSQTSEVQSLCEPNSCTVNCNFGATLRNPDEEIDILF